MAKEAVIDKKEDNKLLVINKEKEKEKKKKRIIIGTLKILSVLIFPVILQIMIELLNTRVIEEIQKITDFSSIGTFIKSIGASINILLEYSFKGKVSNLLILIGILIGVYAMVGRLRKSMLITTIITLILLIINYTLTQIRGTPITPADFYSISLLFGMKSGIKIKLSILVLIPIIVMSIYLIMIFKLELRQTKSKKTTRIISTICSIVIFITFFATNLLKAEFYYNTKEFYERNGLVTSFLTTIKEMKLKKPEGYTKELAIQYMKEILEEEYQEEKYEDLLKGNSKNNPNIIVIMNESLADLEKLYNVKLSEDNMPYIHSLKQNTIKANTYSSALGGKTANCEWEFLTGNTSRFLPAGSTPYQQYIKDETSSIVKILKANGYKTSAYHPYSKSGYNREVVYKLLGFDEIKFSDSLEDINLIRYDDYPDDLSTYKNIIKLFENKEEDEKIFNFTVTMQNHMSYDDKNFENTVFIEGQDREKYYNLNQYMSLVKLSDEAFEYLTKYFESYKEPTIIMMFGDHQPGFVEEYQEIFGEKNDDYIRKEYITPMIVWANYDIEEKELNDISQNYLSNVLLDVAGLEKDNYAKCLEKLYEKYPVVTANNYKENDEFIKYAINPEIFKKYEYIQYYNMFENQR